MRAGVSLRFHPAFVMVFADKCRATGTRIVFGIGDIALTLAIPRSAASEIKVH